MKPHEIEHIEINLLLEALYQRSGYDFRSYARASIERRVRLFASIEGIQRISELIPRFLYDDDLISALVQQFSITVTEMFRDPFVYKTIREKVLPLLRSYPFIKVWHAGCATGEEVYSMAILLEEAGLLKRSTLFGTDFNDSSLEKAKHGIYQADKVKEFTASYQEAGGARSLSNYYHARYGAVTMTPALKEQITFANHNLTADSAFGEMHLIVCRNVLIYFNQQLKDHVLRLFTNSLVRGGFLCLGSREDLRFTAVYEEYDLIDKDARIYKKKAQ